MWVAVPREAEEEEEGGRALWRPGKREALPTNRVKHCVIHAPVRGGGVGKRAKGWRREEGGRIASISGGRTGGVTQQGGLTDATVQARSTGSHSYWEALVAGSSCLRLRSRVSAYSCPTLDDPVTKQLPLSVWFASK